jgi:UDP-N-acetylglucosamine--N-acetylmuramyl-(pentapeptide) pyrophosphoryl-undecaprenol N-acetylglucosamine transferase
MLLAWRTVVLAGGHPLELTIASAGGHLQQAWTLAGRRPSVERIWVTYDVAHARSLLEGERVIFAFHPTTKNLLNAVRNYQLARQVFSERRIDRVVSSGAAVAVPFMIRADQLGIPCHYIESATRVAGPSLSGRMLERISGVRLYRQLGEWGAGRWRQGPRVFDGYEVVAAPEDATVPRRVVVSMGTHHFAFSSLAERFRNNALTGLQVTWQLGSTPAPLGLCGRTTGQLPAAELSRLITDADVVVGHAGVGLTLTALSAGKVPVLVPRRRSRGEHTDDHQVELARALQEMGLAVTADVDELSFEHLERAASLRVVYRQPAPFELTD